MDRGNQEKDSIHETGDRVEAEEVTRLDIPRGSDAETVETVIFPKKGAKPAKAEPVADNVCPHCKSELSNLTSIAWCVGCGYTKPLENAEETRSGKVQSEVDMSRYRGLQHDQAQRMKRELQLSKLKREERSIPIPGLEAIPEWTAVLMCGVLICGIASFTAAMNLRLSPEQRHIWCTVQTVVGVAAIILGHVLACLFVMPERRRFRHFLMCFTPWVWLLAWFGRPRTRWALCFGVWGIALIAGAVLIETACVRGWI
jgi:hypothetical protein